MAPTPSSRDPASFEMGSSVKRSSSKRRASVTREKVPGSGVATSTSSAPASSRSRRTSSVTKKTSVGLREELGDSLRTTPPAGPAIMSRRDGSLLDDEGAIAEWTRDGLALFETFGRVGSGVAWFLGAIVLVWTSAKVSLSRSLTSLSTMTGSSTRQFFSAVSAVLTRFFNLLIDGWSTLKLSRFVSRSDGSNHIPSSPVKPTKLDFSSVFQSTPRKEPLGISASSLPRQSVSVSRPSVSFSESPWASLKSGFGLTPSYRGSYSPGISSVLGLTPRSPGALSPTTIVVARARSRVAWWSFLVAFVFVLVVIFRLTAKVTKNELGSGHRVELPVVSSVEMSTPNTAAVSPVVVSPVAASAGPVMVGMDAVKSHGGVDGSASLESPSIPTTVIPGPPQVVQVFPGDRLEITSRDGTVYSIEGIAREVTKPASSEPTMSLSQIETRAETDGSGMDSASSPQEQVKVHQSVVEPIAQPNEGDVGRAVPVPQPASGEGLASSSSGEPLASSPYSLLSLLLTSFVSGFLCFVVTVLWRTKVEKESTTSSRREILMLESLLEEERNKQVTIPATLNHMHMQSVMDTLNSEHEKEMKVVAQKLELANAELSDLSLKYQALRESFEDRLALVDVRNAQEKLETKAAHDEETERLRSEFAQVLIDLERKVQSELDCLEKIHVQNYSQVVDLANEIKTCYIEDELQPSPEAAAAARHRLAEHNKTILLTSTEIPMHSIATPNKEGTEEGHKTTCFDGENGSADDGFEIEMRHLDKENRSGNDEPLFQRLG